MATKSVNKVQSSQEAFTREERRAAGKTLRETVAREAHTAWKAPATRRDPIAVLIASSKGRIPQLLPIRYGRMMQSPFSFYRGAAAIEERNPI